MLDCHGGHVVFGSRRAAVRCACLSIGRIVIVIRAGVDKLQLRLLRQVVEITHTEHLRTRLIDATDVGLALLRDSEFSAYVARGQVVLRAKPYCVALVLTDGSSSDPVLLILKLLVAKV